MRLSRLDVLMLVAGLGGMGACRRGPPPEPAESATVPTTPAESTVFQAAAARVTAQPCGPAGFGHRRPRCPTLGSPAA